MRIYDITMVLEEGMLVYPGDPELRILTRLTVARDGFHSTSLELGSHAGTHVDAPKHFLPDGKAIDEIPLDLLVGDCRVLDFTGSEKSITRKDLLEKDLNRGDILLFKTKNSFETSKKFKKDYVYLDEDAADLLLERGVKTVGIDYLSIERFGSKDCALHKRLLPKIPIIEGLVLKDVDEGEYLLCCLPLKVKGAEAAPARAILLKR